MTDLGLIYFPSRSQFAILNVSMATCYYKCDHMLNIIQHMQVTQLMACILNAFSFSKWYCTFKTKD